MPSLVIHAGYERGGGWGGMGGLDVGLAFLLHMSLLVSERPATFGTRPKIKLQCINKIYYSWSYICVIPLSYSTFWIFFVRFANEYWIGDESLDNFH